MTQGETINAELQRLVAVSGWCYAIGLRIRFNHPTLLYQTYPEAWITHYARNGLLFFDPAVRWGMTQTGICDWADLAAEDTAGVLQTAAEFGLVHGIVISVGDEATRSLGFFAHSRRALDDDERRLAQGVVTRLHDLTEGVADLAPDEIAPLQALNDHLRPPPAAAATGPAQA
jgi:LuxR family transcriptional regulator, quorum-sensing system regulator SdiA